MTPTKQGRPLLLQATAVHRQATAAHRPTKFGPEPWRAQSVERPDQAEGRQDD